MQIKLPFNYKITGVRKGERSTKGKTCVDNVLVDIPEIDPGEFPIALELLDQTGMAAETFHHYNGSFWIKDSPTEGRRFGNQHSILLGRWPRAPRTSTGRNRYYYPSEDAAKDNDRGFLAMGRLGILRYVTTDATVGAVLPKDFWERIKLPYVEAEGGIVCVPSTPEEEYRIIETNDQSERANAVAAYAMANALSVAGELYVKVPEPAIYVTDSEAGWCFSGYLRDPHSPGDGQDGRIDKAYKIPMTDFESITSSFPFLSQEGRVKFEIGSIDASCFDIPDIRETVAMDIQKAIDEQYHLHRQETAFIHKWCDLRDLVNGMEGDLKDREPWFFDTAAEILVVMDMIRGKDDFPAAKMWTERAIQVPDALQFRPLARQNGG